MNKEQRLARAAKLLADAERNPHSNLAETWLDMAKVHIQLANATESMNVLTDKELAEAKRNVEILNECGKMAQELMSLGGESKMIGRILHDKVYYS